MEIDGFLLSIHLNEDPTENKIVIGKEVVATVTTPQKVQTRPHSK